MPSFSVSVPYWQRRVVIEEGSFSEDVEAETEAEALAKFKQMVEDEELLPIIRHSNDDHSDNSDNSYNPDWPKAEVYPYED